MNKNAGDDQDERKFLHDLSNSLSVVFGNLQLLLSKLEKDNKPTVQMQDVLPKLQKSVQYLDKVNELLDARRTYLRSQET